jgi:hypothetical protein
MSHGAADAGWLARMSDGRTTRYDVTLQGAMGPMLCSTLGNVRLTRTSRSVLVRLRCSEDYDLVDLDRLLTQRGLTVISIRRSRGSKT